MFDALARYSKAIAAAVGSFVVTVALVWQDQSISLDELNVLKAAVVALLVAAGVAVSPRNRP